MSKLSMRQIAKELEISPAYLSYMLNGKRPWRKDLYQRYMGVVNTFVNSEELTKRETAPQSMPLRGDFVPKNCLAGVRGSRTHLPRSSRGITDLKYVAMPSVK